MSWLSRLSPVHYLYLVLHAALVAVGILLTNIGGQVSFAIGTSLFATGLTGWVVFVYVFLSDKVRTQIDLISSLRIISYFTTRGSSIRKEYESRLDRAKSRIDVMGFGQRALLEDQGSKFDQWKSRASIRILLLDPEFPDALSSVCALRDSDEEQRSDTIASEVRNFVKQTASLQDDRFQIRLYRCLPAVNIFRVDDELFWGPYLIHRVSRNSPTFVVERGGDLFTELMDHFEVIWRDDGLSRGVPSEWRTN